jgi:hypothetical protein
MLAKANIYKNLQIPRCETLYKEANLRAIIHVILHMKILHECPSSQA